MAKPLAKLPPLPKTRRAQFSLGPLFVVVTALCIGLGMVADRAHRQRDAVAAIEALGGSVYYAEPDQKATEPFGRSFLQRWLSRDYFDEVRAVYFRSSSVTDAGLTHLPALGGLHELHLDGTNVTDAGLLHLKMLTSLQELWLDGTQVTDAGLAQLRGLTSLRWLDLEGTQITDAGLAQLQELTCLRGLNLRHSHVTVAGVARLRQALPECLIYGPVRI